MNRLNALLTDELDTMQSALDLFISLVCVLLLEIAVPATPQDIIEDSTQGNGKITKQLIVYPGHNDNEFIDGDGNIVKEFVADKVILALDGNMPIKQSLNWQRQLKLKTPNIPVFIRTSAVINGLGDLCDGPASSYFGAGHRSPVCATG